VLAVAVVAVVGRLEVFREKERGQESKVYHMWQGAGLPRRDLKPAQPSIEDASCIVSKAASVEVLTPFLNPGSAPKHEQEITERIVHEGSKVFEGFPVKPRRLKITFGAALVVSAVMFCLCFGRHGSIN